MSLRHAYKRIKNFNAGRSDTHDEQRTDPLQDPINDETILLCESSVLAEDHWCTISDIRLEISEW